MAFSRKKHLESIHMEEVGPGGQVFKFREPTQFEMVQIIGSIPSLSPSDDKENEKHSGSEHENEARFYEKIAVTCLIEPKIAPEGTVPSDDQLLIDEIPHWLLRRIGQRIMEKASLIGEQNDQARSFRQEQEPVRTSRRGKRSVRSEPVGLHDGKSTSPGI